MGWSLANGAKAFAAVATAVAISTVAGGSNAAESNQARSLQQMVDRAEIENLMAALVFAADRRDATTWAAYFAPGGELRTVPSTNHPDAGVVYKGATLPTFLTKNIRPAAPGATAAPTLASATPAHHIVTSNYITFTGPNTAKHYGYWMMAGGGGGAAAAAAANADPAAGATAATPAGGAGGARIAAIGSYDDEFVRINGKWMLKTRIIHYGDTKPD